MGQYIKQHILNTTSLLAQEKYNNEDFTVRDLKLIRH
jgi:hypothetical protein